MHLGQRGSHTARRGMVDVASLFNAGRAAYGPPIMLIRDSDSGLASHDTMQVSSFTPSPLLMVVVGLLTISLKLFSAIV